MVNLSILCLFGLGTTEILLITIFFLLPLWLLPMIFFLLTLQKALQLCSIQNRIGDPSQVWLMLIPVFNLVWQFILVSHISTSLGNEFRSRNIQKEPEPGKSIGLAFCILTVCSIIPFLGFLTAIGGLICWIMYWSKISTYSTELLYSQQNKLVSS